MMTASAAVATAGLEAAEATAAAIGVAIGAETNCSNNST